MVVTVTATDGTRAEEFNAVRTIATLCMSKKLSHGGGIGKQTRSVSHLKVKSPGPSTAINVSVIVIP